MPAQQVKIYYFSLRIVVLYLSGYVIVLILTDEQRHFVDPVIVEFAYVLIIIFHEQIANFFMFGSRGGVDNFLYLK